MRVDVATEDDAEAVIDMLKKSFFPNEPLNASIGLVGADGGCPELEAYCRVAVPTGLSLCARAGPEAGADAEAVVGVILNEVIRRGEGPRPEDARVREGDSKFDKILAVNHAAEVAADVFAAHPDVQRALDVKILATDPTRTKSGIATALMARTLELARAQGLPLVRCVCSGAFSARVAERSGFSRLGGVAYDAFLGPDGAPVFSPPPPHTAITVWALRL
ncbi:dopamine N-acetyltransferase-like [Thrips palmi]|uniref:aralkylamine N-acetyltransferase n=1 Tax=Thrips palmi TaxID=161013 RepID=A0A6P9ALE2_THRPL|nr:dopamine N-acetyltransferase-like [Thrips palmi]XP_034256332.1 dopamine N-acetyltransferase-like [Thrips palmi]